NTWNKHALDFTIKVNNEERKKQLKHKQELLKEFIKIILSPNETGFLVRNIDFIIDSSIDNISLPQNDDDNLQVLNEEIKEKLAHNQPELILDRLHTYATIFLRKICNKYKIVTTKQNGDNLPLHSLIGSLVRKYEEKNLSDFSITTLKMSISIFDKYNDIRNNHSLAHDNEILNKNEARFVVVTISNLLNFIDTIEENLPVLPVCRELRVDF
ncbi:MAG: abortive infection family protein, partial [Neisseriaceae bacterium]|nr:abortive infection family protein [Neisseriaceae bacterium]